MRKFIILITLFFSIYTISNAQFFNESVKWKEASVQVYPKEQILSFTEYKIKGKTEIDGKTYFNLYEDGNLNYYIRETEDKKVYVYCPKRGREFLCYDFEWQVGKEIYYQPFYRDGEFSSIKIDKINSIKLLDKKSYNYIDRGKDSYIGTSKMIINGICHNHGFFYLLKQKPISRREILYEFYRDDILVYQTPKKIPLDIKNSEENNPATVYPQPARDNITFKFKAEDAEELRVYNSKGVLIKTYNINKASTFKIEEALQAGVYFYTVQYKRAKTLSGKFIIKN